MMGGFGFGGRLSDDDLDRTRQGPRMIKERVLLLPALLDLSMPGTSGIDRLWTYLDPFGRQVVFDPTATNECDGPAASAPACDDRSD
jgi:hypothetical protein